jgi:hypothetical protein
MKFFLVALTFLVVGAVADDKYFVSEEDGVKVFDRALEDINDQPWYPKQANLLFDKHCMYNKIKDANLLKYLNKDYIIENRSDRTTALLVWLTVSMQCSDKSNAIVEFVFENLMTFHVLYKSIMKEPALRNYTHYVNYANKYAVDNHFIGETVHGTKVNIAVDNEDNYSEFRELVNVATGVAKIGARKEFMRTCAIGIVDDLEKLFAHTVLLIQFELTFDQKRKERENFVRGVKNFFDAILPCAVTPRTQLPEVLASKLPF